MTGSPTRPQQIGRFHSNGYGLICAVPECRQNTAEQAPNRFWRQPETATQAATRLGWIHAALQPGEAHVWFCPMHQKFDETSGRWVPAIRLAA